MTTKSAKRFCGSMLVVLILTLLFILGVVDRVWGASFGNTVTTSSGEASGTTCKALSALPYTLAPSSNIVIDSISFYGRSVTAQTVYLGIYRWRNNLPTDSLITVGKSLGITGTQWNAEACSLSVSAGDTICIVIGSAGTPLDMRINSIDSAGNNRAYTASATLTDPWVNSGYSAKLLCTYAVYHVSGSTAATTYTATKKTVPKW